MINRSYMLTRLELRISAVICCLFILSYFLSFEIGTFLGLRVRLEEVAVVMVLLQLLYLGAKKGVIDAIPDHILIPFSIIYIYSLFITLVGWIHLSWNLTGFIYLIRDIQYFAVGLLFFLVMSSNNYYINKNFNVIDKTIILSVCLNIAWSIYQLVSGDYRGHYATAAIGLDGSAASSGISYYACLVLISFLYVRTERKSLIILMALSLMAILLTSSRTFSLAALIFLAIWCCLFYLHVIARMLCKAVISKTALLFSSFILFVAMSLLMTSSSLITDNYFYENITAKYGVISRFSRIDDGIDKRYSLIASETNEIRENSIGFYLGNGKGQYEKQFGKFKVGMHSQFSRLVNEVGVVGIILWLGFFGVLALKFLQNGFLSPPMSRVAISFVISFLSTFFSYDVLLISKSAFLFWIIVFIMFANFRRVKLMVMVPLKPNLNEA